ncbi:DUF1127 domain-containing protein [Pseudomonas sp.]|uniref:DUF1127 domain-containing protein n=1 Tax=Pseudomonas sp. TaxID=306 RepID=UPI003C3532B1
MTLWTPLCKRLLLKLGSLTRRVYERRKLAQLDSRELADAGISYGERMAELSKPFWRD